MADYIQVVTTTERKDDAERIARAERHRKLDLTQQELFDLFDLFDLKCPEGPVKFAA